MSTTEDAATSAEEYSPRKSALYWKEQLQHSEKAFETWESRGDRVVERFRDERKATEIRATKFNILWSNVQVLKPSLYGRKAKPEVSRRYMDADPVGRLASTILERALEYETTQFPDFDDSMSAVVEDRLLPGRGTIWMRYEPVITSEETPPPSNVEITSDEPVLVESIASAHAPVDYVYWKDFRHSPARTWEEVWWSARRTYLTREEGEKRFGEKFALVPLGEYKEDNSRKTKDSSEFNAFAKKAVVWEIWNKRTGKVCWLAKDFDETLDEKDDPLQLEGFFPCPKPLYATTTNGSLIPVPDYVEYQDQAEELDSITGRITRLVKAIRATGVVNAEFKEVARLFSEASDNKLIPVGNWGALSEKGGLDGAVQLLDLTTQIQALGTLYKARDTVIATIYQISGISDIMRGDSKAEETLGAQQLKANFGSLRLRTQQTDVARFASNIFQLKAQIMCRFYPKELLVQMSGVAATADGRDPQRLQAALQLLEDPALRDFHITIESDSLAQMDDDAEKAAANEAIQAIGAFIKEALPAVQAAPEILPMISEMLLFLVRRYRAGRVLESAIEQAMAQLQAAASQPKGPSQEQIEAQMQQQSDQARMQMEAQVSQMKAQQDAAVQQSKLQAEAQLEQLKMQMENQRMQFEARIESAAAERELQFKMAELSATDATERFKAELQASTQLAIADVNAKTTNDVADKKLQETQVYKGFTNPKLDELFNQVQDMMGQVEEIKSRPVPKGKKVVRDSEGRISHVVPME